MKILNVVSNPNIGGTETLLLQTAPYFERGGYIIDILNTWRNSAMKEPALESNLSYKELSGNSRHIRLRDLVEIVHVIRDKKYDIVQSFGLRITLLLRILKPFYYRTPLVIGLHGVDDWRKWYHIFLDRLTKSQCDMFVPNSNAVAERFMRKEKISRDKMVVIKNGTDTEEFDKGKFEKVDKESLNLPSDKIIITTLASLRFEKGHEFYIQVIQRYLAQLQNVHFVWIGRGVLKPFLEKKLDSIGALDQVTMIDYAEDVRPILSCSDIFVLPSREEGMPRAMMEAMSMSLPCVATNVGGVGEVLEDGVSGLIADFGDVETFGSCILDLINNQDLCQKMGAAARERVAKNFNMEMITKKHMKFFELIAAGHRDGVEIQKQIDELTESLS